MWPFEQLNKLIMMTPQSTPTKQIANSTEPPYSASQMQLLEQTHMAISSLQTPTDAHSLHHVCQVLESVLPLLPVHSEYTSGQLLLDYVHTSQVAYWTADQEVKLGTVKAYISAVLSATQELLQARAQFSAVNILISQALTRAQLTTMWELLQPPAYLHLRRNNGNVYLHHAAEALSSVFSNVKLAYNTQASDSNDGPVAQASDSKVPDVGPDATVANVVRRVTQEGLPGLHNEEHIISLEHLDSITIRTPDRLATGLTFAPQQNFRILNRHDAKPGESAMLAKTAVQIDTMSNVNLMSLKDAQFMGLIPDRSKRSIGGSNGEPPRQVDGFITFLQLQIAITSTPTFSWDNTVVVDTQWLVLDEQYLENCPLLGIPFIRAIDAHLCFDEYGPSMYYSDKQKQRHHIPLSFSSVRFIPSLEDRQPK